MNSSRLENTAALTAVRGAALSSRCKQKKQKRKKEHKKTKSEA